MNLEDGADQLLGNRPLPGIEKRLELTRKALNALLNALIRARTLTLRPDA